MILDHKAVAAQFSGKTYPDPSDSQVREKMEEGRREFEKSYLGRMYPYVLLGRRIYSNELSGAHYVTRDPNNPEMIVGYFCGYTPGFAKDLQSTLLPAIRAAGRKFAQEVSWKDRVRLLQTISQVAQERFWILCAAKAYEGGQSIAEQIGETDEEVDFPLANAINLERMHNDLLPASPAFAGEYNGKRYVPHGVFVNFSPFNFPGAIPMDMATKALAMGNAFIEKSSPKSSLCGYLVFETIVMAFERLGIDWRGVVNYMPGGKDVADALLSSPDVSGLSFTGSTQVLRNLREKYGRMDRNGWAGKGPLVYGSAETSGVNVMIVTAQTDVKRAAEQYVKSFIGRQGQKCSSARVCFVDQSIQSAFVKKTIRILEALRYGDVKDGAEMGAMITKEASATLFLQIKALLRSGFADLLYKKMILPHSDSDFPPILLTATLAQSRKKKFPGVIMNTEFFGPVSTIVPFEALAQVEAACAHARFALTGAFFTSDPVEAQNILSFIPAGNVYVERKCTGALVETECFGGLRSASSPTGIKGAQALALFGSMQTLSGFYPEGDIHTRKAWQTMLEEQGFVLSKI